MKVGLQVSRFQLPRNLANIGSKLAEIARKDDSGFHGVLVLDYFYQLGQGYGASERAGLSRYLVLYGFK